MRSLLFIGHFHIFCFCKYNSRVRFRNVQVPKNVKNSYTKNNVAMNKTISTDIRDSLE